ncbi:MAG: TetR family transcriptional regulator [Opitutaceae bacterium]
MAIRNAGRKSSGKGKPGRVARLQSVELPKAAKKKTKGAAVKARDPGTENALLVATADLLTKKGNLDFSLAEVAAQADMSAALVQYYFGGKHGLLSALMEWSSSRYVAQINGLLALDLNAIEKLRIHVRALVKTYTKTPYIDRLLHHLISASDEAEAKRISDYYVGRVVEFYRHLIDEGVREGLFRPIDPMHLYFILLGTGDHLAARRRLLTPVIASHEMDADFVREFSDVLADVLLKGISKAD